MKSIELYTLHRIIHSLNILIIVGAVDIVERNAVDLTVFGSKGERWLEDNSFKARSSQTRFSAIASRPQFSLYDPGSWIDKN